MVSQDPVFLALGDSGRVKQLTGQDERGFNSARTMGGLNKFVSGWSGRMQSTGNSISQDEWLADPQMQNSYSYSRNNPLAYTDSDGHAAVYFNLNGNVGGGGSVGITFSGGMATDGSYGLSISWNAGGFAGGDASVNGGVGYSSAKTWGDTGGENRYITGGAKVLGVGGSGNVNISPDGKFNGGDVSVGLGPSTPIYTGGGIGKTYVVVNRNLKDDAKAVANSASNIYISTKQVVANAVDVTVNTAKKAWGKVTNCFK